MAESTTNLKLDALDVRIRDSVKVFAEKLSAGLGDNLQSITVVGSGLTEDFMAGYSDINTVVILGGQTVVSLNTIAALARPMSRKKISPPLLMTSSYIERSRDVFGVEFLDFQLTHQTSHPMRKGAQGDAHPVKTRLYRRRGQPETRARCSYLDGQSPRSAAARHAVAQGHRPPRADQADVRQSGGRVLGQHGLANHSGKMAA
ncbi:MAG: hypothetical protein ACYS74_05550 [Planctomycetota bacterium]